MPRRPPRIEIARSTVALFPELEPTPPTDAILRAMTYRGLLLWAADRDGRLRSDRLRRIARAKNFSSGLGEATCRSASRARLGRG